MSSTKPKIEMNVNLTDLTKEAASEIPALQFFHAPRAYAAVKLCEEYGFFDDPDIGEKLIVHIDRMRTQELLGHLGPSEMTEQIMGLKMVTEGQKAARKASEAAKKKRAKP